MWSIAFPRYVVPGILVLLLIPHQSAHAYIDPGTGSYILQLIVGGSLAGVFLAKMYWKKLVSVFSRNKPEEDDEQ